MTDKTKRAPRLPLRENPTGRGLMLVTLALIGLGLVMVHSAVGSVAGPANWYAREDFKHTVFALTAVGVVLLGWRFRYTALASGRRAPIIAAMLLAVSLICGALVFVPGVGHAVGGRWRWIRVPVGPTALTFQPSEMIRLTMVIFLAAYLTRPGRSPRAWRRSFLPALCVVGLCVAAVITQDFGTGMLLAVIAGATLLLAGVTIWALLPLAAMAAGAFYFLVVCDPSRWERIAVLADPWASQSPAAYQPRQAMIAIASGGWTGAGVGNSMTKLGYLPEDSTDFITAGFVNEWGVVGAVLLTGLVVLWLLHARKAAVKAADSFGYVLAASLGFALGLQAVLHLAVDLVLLPPTGMGLPFVSAGGTALILNAAAVALIISVSARATKVARASDSQAIGPKDLAAAGPGR